MTAGTRKKRPVDFITIAAVIIVVAVIVANVTKQQSAEPEVATSTGTESPAEAETPDVTEPTPSTLQTSFAMPEEFEGKTKAEEIINSTQGKSVAAGNWEQIVYGIVTDEKNQEVVYFATSQNNGTGNFVGIYQYNTRTYQWQRFYKNAYIPNGGESANRLHVLGKDGDNLVIAIDHMDDILDRCESAWLEGASAGLKTLNIDEPLDGLADYVLPEDLRAAEEEKVAECLNP